MRAMRYYVKNDDEMTAPREALLEKPGASFRTTLSWS